MQRAEPVGGNLIDARSETASRNYHANKQGGEGSLGNVTMGRRATGLALSWALVDTVAADHS